MEQYINKSTLVAEIEKWIKHYNESAKEFGDEGYNDNVLMEQCKANACKYILSFLDTLEVKEVQEPVSEDLEKIVEEIAEPTILNAYGTKELARRLRNTICGTSVSEDLEKAAKNHAAERYRTTRNRELAEKCKWSFKTGAEWQKKHLWRDAQGDDLPDIDREVIALEGIVDPTATDCLCGYKVIFAHRPATEGYDGKSITTGETEHYTPKTYGEGGWNIPNIAYWLDVELPKEIEL